MGCVRTPLDLICGAIRARSVLQFRYHDRMRVVAPYCCGISTRGAAVLRAVQLRGDSVSGGLGFGKLWTLDEIVDLRVLHERFVPDDPHYNPRDRAMQKIYCAIEPGDA